jgi:hypothetical protein
MPLTIFRSLIARLLLARFSWSLDCSAVSDIGFSTTRLTLCPFRSSSEVAQSMQIVEYGFPLRRSRSITSRRWGVYRLAASRTSSIFNHEIFPLAPSQGRYLSASSLGFGCGLGGYFLDHNQELSIVDCHGH